MSQIAVHKTFYRLLWERGEEYLQYLHLFLCGTELDEILYLINIQNTGIQCQNCVLDQNKTNKNEKY
jgi:hypothetical protein